MIKFEMPFVERGKGRDGRVRYWYFRRNGRRWRLPGTPLSEVFMEAHRRLVALTEPSPGAAPRGYMPGSLGVLVDDYFASPEFRTKKLSTQKIYRQILEPLAERHGHKPVDRLERKHIREWRDARRQTPGMANMIVRVIRLLMAYAIDRDYRTDNPALRLQMLPIGEWRAWSEEECAAFEAHWPAGSMPRRAYMLAKFTGQRCGDLARMTRAHYKDNLIRVVQQKTGAELWIPVHRALAAELATSLKHMSLLTKADGGSFDNDSLSQWFADVIGKAGLPDRCVLHGLRKTAAVMLAEVGCSTHEIASITGHRALKQIEAYTASREPEDHGDGCDPQLERNAKGTADAKRPRRVSAKQKPRG